jgi:hypothetical protein
VNLWKPMVPALSSAVLLLSASMVGRADIQQFDQNLADPNGVYYGSGNVNGGFTTVQSFLGIELGLRAKLRDPALAGAATVIHSSTNVYEVPTGTYAPNRALWNYDWSINLLNTFGNTLPDITAELTVTDLNTNAKWTIDPLSHWTDNAGWGYPNAGGSPTAFNLQGQHVATGFVVYGAQNSENPGFGDFRTALGFNPNAASSYQFDLTVTDGAFKATDTMIVNSRVDAPVPEPASFVLLAICVTAIGVSRRKKPARS